jgi:hypothetical protein
MGEEDFAAGGAFGQEKSLLAHQRHKDLGKPDLVPKKIAKWRMRERVSESFEFAFGSILFLLVKFDNVQQMKTVSVALAYCLNIGVDPPDIIKTEPCARMECWMGKLLVHFVHLWFISFRSVAPFPSKSSRRNWKGTSRPI